MSKKSSPGTKASKEAVNDASEAKTATDAPKNEAKEGNTSSGTKKTDRKKPSSGKEKKNDEETTSAKDEAKEEIPKELSVSELMSMMDAKTKEFHALGSRIESKTLEIAELKDNKSKLGAKIKSIPLPVRTFNPDRIEFESTTPEEKMAIRLGKKLIKNQIILKEGELSRMKNEYAAYGSGIAQLMHERELRNKAQSQHWTKRNRWSLEGRVVKLLNRLKIENPKLLENLKKLAMADGLDHKLKFDTALQKTLDKIDAETSILCSHQLKSVMYEAIRNAIRKWDGQKTYVFAKLKFRKK